MLRQPPEKRLISSWKALSESVLEAELAEDEIEVEDDETPDWMQALRGIADDVPESEDLDEEKPDIQPESEQMEMDDAVRNRIQTPTVSRDEFAKNRPRYQRWFSKRLYQRTLSIF